MTDPIIRNPLTLNDDALGENFEPVAQADGDPGSNDMQDGCLVCGTPLPPGPDFCTQECEEKGLLR